MTITAKANIIVMVARHAASEPPPPHFIAAAASIAAILDAAGITYTAREYTGTISDPPPAPCRRARRKP